MSFVSSITQCQFIGNYAQKASDVLISGGSATITNCTFANARAIESAGSCKVLPGTMVTFSGCLFTGCVSNIGAGGALQTAGVTTVRDTIFSNCTSTEGGAVKATSRDYSFNG